MNKVNITIEDLKLIFVQAMNALNHFSQTVHGPIEAIQPLTSSFITSINIGLARGLISYKLDAYDDHPNIMLIGAHFDDINLALAGSYVQHMENYERLHGDGKEHVAKAMNLCTGKTFKDNEAFLQMKLVHINRLLQ